MCFVSSCSLHCYADVLLFISLKICVCVFCCINVNANSCNVFRDDCPRLFNFSLTALLSDLHGMLCDLSKLLLVSLFKWRYVCSSNALGFFLNMLFALYSILITVEKKLLLLWVKAIFSCLSNWILYLQKWIVALSCIDLLSFIRQLNVVAWVKRAMLLQLYSFILILRKIFSTHYVVCFSKQYTYVC